MKRALLTIAINVTYWTVMCILAVIVTALGIGLGLGVWVVIQTVFGSCRP